MNVRRELEEKLDRERRGWKEKGEELKAELAKVKREVEEGRLSLQQVGKLQSELKVSQQRSVVGRGRWRGKVVQARRKSQPRLGGGRREGVGEGGRELEKEGGREGVSWRWRDGGREGGTWRRREGVGEGGKEWEEEGGMGGRRDGSHISLPPFPTPSLLPPSPTPSLPPSFPQPWL